MKIKEVTPKAFSCGVGPCPSIYETDRDSYLIVGAVVNEKDPKPLKILRIGKNETVIEVPKNLILNFLK